MNPIPKPDNITNNSTFIFSFVKFLSFSFVNFFFFLHQKFIDFLLQNAVVTAGEKHFLPQRKNNATHGQGRFIKIDPSVCPTGWFPLYIQQTPPGTLLYFRATESARFFKRAVEQTLNL